MFHSAYQIDSAQKRESSAEKGDPYGTASAAFKPDAKKLMSVKEFVALNKNNLRLSKTPLRYHPTARMDKQSILQWDRLQPKTCYLDDIMKAERKKIGPQ